MKKLVLFLLSCVVVLYASTLDMENYIKKSDEVLALLKKNISKSTLPGLDDKQMAKLFTSMAKIQPSITSKTYEVKDIGDLLNVTGKASQIQVMYMTHGLKSVINKKDSREEIGVKMSQLMRKNSIKYQDSLEITFPFLLDGFAIVSNLLNSYWNSLPQKAKTKTRINGIVQARKGIARIYLGLFDTLKDKEIKDSFRKSLLKSAKNSAPSLVKLLPLDKRSSMLNVLIENKKDIPKIYMDDFNGIINAFSSKKCNGICKVSL